MAGKLRGALRSELGEATKGLLYFGFIGLAFFQWFHRLSPN